MGTGRAIVFAWLLVPALAGGRARAGGDADDDGPPAPPPPFVIETATVPTEDGLMLAANYGPAGGRAYTAAVVLVHQEGSTKAAWEPLYARMQEHRVPWLAIDLRGHGGSASQAGVDLSARARAHDPALQAAMAEDVWAAVRFLVDKKGHDPKRIGIMAAGLGASAAVRCAHLHKGEIAGLALLTPRLDYAGLDTSADAHDLDGKMEVRILSSVQDMNTSTGDNDKKGPRHLLYQIEVDRNAPRDTPYDEREAKRRGLPPRLRGLAETGVFGTKMIQGVRQMDCWLAAWWARTLRTYPFPVLYDGIVDRANDFADPSWDAGAKVPGPPGLDARALRWGRRVMLGSELPKDVRTIRLRIQVSRGPEETGQIGTIEYPSGDLTVTRVQKKGRHEPIELGELVMPPPEIPVGKGEVVMGNPSFEVEYRLPALNGTAPYEVRLAYEVVLQSGAEVTGTGVDPEKPETWTVVPDVDVAAPPAPPAPPGPAKPPPPPAMGFPGR